jgi:hypothetical protein
LILWALKSDRDARIQSMQEFVDELEPFASERAFLAQMTDVGHTLPSIVLRPSAEPRAFEGIDRPARHQRVPGLVRASDSERSPERISDAPRQSEDTAVGDELAVPYRSRLLPVLLAVAAALVLVGIGTRLARRFSNASAHASQGARPPPPLPFFDGGLIVPATSTGDDWDQLAPERAALPAASAQLSVDAAIAFAPIVETEQTQSPVRDAHPARSEGVSTSVDKSKRAATAVTHEPQRGAPRIRAGQVRAQDFLPQ